MPEIVETSLDEIINKIRSSKTEESHKLDKKSRLIKCEVELLYKNMLEEGFRQAQKMSEGNFLFGINKDLEDSIEKKKAIKPCDSCVEIFPCNQDDWFVCGNCQRLIVCED